MFRCVRRGSISIRKSCAGPFRKKPKAIVVCNPSNPSGKVFTREELIFIGELAEEAGAFIITDEVYEHIVYPPHRHTYAAGLPGLFERTLTVGSLSKTYAITGWRLGFLLAAPEVISAARKVHDFLTVGAAHPLQQAAVTALQFPQEYYDKLASDYAARRELFTGYLRKAGLTFVEPQGAYYVLVDISEFGHSDDTAFCHWLAKEIGSSGGAWFQLFRRTGEPPDPVPLCQARRDVTRGGTTVVAAADEVVAYRPWWGEAPERPKQVRGGPDFPVRGVLLGLVVAEPVPWCATPKRCGSQFVLAASTPRGSARGSMVPIG